MPALLCVVFNDSYSVGHVTNLAENGGFVETWLRISTFPPFLLHSIAKIESPGIAEMTIVNRVSRFRDAPITIQEKNMNKRLISIVISSALMAATAQNAAANDVPHDDGEKDHFVGAGIGAVTGALLAGPVGFIAGGVIGGRFLEGGIPGNVFFVCVLLGAIWLSLHGIGGFVRGSTDTGAEKGL